VRQLENLCHWLTVMAPGQQVEIGDLPVELREASPVAQVTDWEGALEGEVDRLLARGVPDVHGVLAQVFERILITRALAHRRPAHRGGAGAGHRPQHHHAQDRRARHRRRQGACGGVKSVAWH
jgi:DNA-binding NtrC family response regulator